MARLPAAAAVRGASSEAISWPGGRRWHAAYDPRPADFEVRLLTLKWVAGALFSGGAHGGHGHDGTGDGLLFFRWGGLFVFVPGELFGVFPAAEGFGRYVAAHTLMTVKAVTITGLAFGFGCLPIKPAAATILALSFIF